MTSETSRAERWYHLRVRITPSLGAAVRDFARKERMSVSHLLRSMLERELAAAESGSAPDESAIREMAILVAVELVLKLQEASIPGGTTLSRRLVEDAARAAISRVELVEANLQKAARR